MTNSFILAVPFASHLENYYENHLNQPAANAKHSVDAETKLSDNFKFEVSMKGLEDLINFLNFLHNKLNDDEESDDYLWKNSIDYKPTDLTTTEIPPIQANSTTAVGTDAEDETLKDQDIINFSNKKSKEIFFDDYDDTFSNVDQELKPMKGLSELRKEDHLGYIKSIYKTPSQPPQHFQLFDIFDASPYSILSPLLRPQTKPSAPVDNSDFLEGLIPKPKVTKNLSVKKQKRKSVKVSPSTSVFKEGSINQQEDTDLTSIDNDTTLIEDSFEEAFKEVTVVNKIISTPKNQDTKLGKNSNLASEKITKPTNSDVLSSKNENTVEKKIEKVIEKNITILSKEKNNNAAKKQQEKENSFNHLKKNILKQDFKNKSEITTISTYKTTVTTTTKTTEEEVKVVEKKVEIVEKDVSKNIKFGEILVPENVKDHKKKERFSKHKKEKKPKNHFCYQTDDDHYNNESQQSKKQDVEKNQIDQLISHRNLNETTIVNEHTKVNDTNGQCNVDNTTFNNSNKMINEISSDNSSNNANTVIFQATEEEFEDDQKVNDKNTTINAISSDNENQSYDLIKKKIDKIYFGEILSSSFEVDFSTPMFSGLKKMQRRIDSKMNLLNVDNAKPHSTVSQFLLDSNANGENWEVLDLGYLDRSTFCGFNVGMDFNNSSADKFLLNSK
ncbi:hypothetical protein HK099_002540 [Clydaea vesicula]|uniref:Uncharacterized protein n=1 Tax=Clydaea vesicula TaxID=447962 RepID=A0AAD5XWN3_9FUNG|nr:hypothetical protein HK099_002540 [Clydaea vesicula]